MYFHTLPPEINRILAQGLQPSVSVKVERYEFQTLIITEVEYLSNINAHRMYLPNSEIEQFLISVESTTEIPEISYTGTGIYCEPSGSQGGIVTLLCVDGDHSHKLVMNEDVSTMFIAQLRDAYAMYECA